VAAVTIGSVYELKYAAAPDPDWLPLNLHDVLIRENSIRPSNPISAVLRISRKGKKTLRELKIGKIHIGFQFSRASPESASIQGEIMKNKVAALLSAVVILAAMTGARMMAVRRRIPRRTSSKMQSSPRAIPPSSREPQAWRTL
jgi:hypothetical protein